VDLSSASAISALENCPLEDFAMRFRHIADNDVPPWNGGWITTPCDLAHRMISSLV
jgi:hypothetical protein